MRNTVITGIVLVAISMGCASQSIGDEDQSTDFPVADCGSIQEVNPGSVVKVDGSGSRGLDGKEVIYSWGFSSLPENSLLTNEDLSAADSAVSQFTPHVGGVYILELVIFSGTQSDSCLAVITVAHPDKEKEVKKAEIRDHNKTIPLPSVKKVGSEQKTGKKNSDGAGRRKVYRSDNFILRLRYVPPKLFPSEQFDSKTRGVHTGFWIGETEIPYKIWKTVYDWAINNGYVFREKGWQGRYFDGQYGQAYQSGHEDHPVTHISWRHAVVWCNALTEYFNKVHHKRMSPVYYSDKRMREPIRKEPSSNSIDYPNPGSIDDPYVKEGADGFRLPTRNEFELASRYIGDFNSDGDILDPGEYYPYNYLSGSRADISDIEASQEAAWYGGNNGQSTQPVGLKPPNGNALGLFDMSGNISEHCFDWFTAKNYGKGNSRTICGRSYLTQKDLWYYSLFMFGGYKPYYSSDGFRVVISNID